MKLEFDVKMTVSKMYDYLLYHTYHGFQGILGEMVGILLIVAYFITDSATYPYRPAYLIFGIIVFFYLPVTLYINARRQVNLQPAYKEPLHYVLTEEAIEVHVGEQSDSVPWDQLKKATSTSKSIILYTSKNTATLFPRADMGKLELEVIKYISTHMDPKKVNIKI